MAITVMAMPLWVGCFDSPGTIIRLQREIDQHELDLKACAQKAFECEIRRAELTARIENQPRLATVGIEDLFVVDQIKIPSRSGGIDLDGKPGDEGVVVYVQPIDAAGDVIKAAGAITIQLTDLTTIGSPRTIATLEYTKPDIVKKSWYGGFLTNHYSFKCPFPESAAPVPGEVHVRVLFFDWLTGREFSASTTVKVNVSAVHGAPRE